MRVTTSKSKNSESFYISKGYVNNKGVSTSVIIRKLGTLKDLLPEHGPTRDDVMKWAREEARLETLKYKKEQQAKSVQITFHSDHKLDYNQQVFYRGIYFTRKRSASCISCSSSASVQSATTRRGWAKFRQKSSMKLWALILLCSSRTVIRKGREVARATKSCTSFTLRRRISNSLIKVPPSIYTKNHFSCIMGSKDPTDLPNRSQKSSC